MEKSVNYKNLILLLPILGVISTIIILFFPTLKAEVMVNGQITDTYKYWGWDLIFAEKSKAYYTGIGLVFLILSIINIAFITVFNFLVYKKSNKCLTLLFTSGLILTSISFISFVAVVAIADFFMYKAIYTADNVWIEIESNIISLPIWSLFFVGIGFCLSYLLSRKISNAKVEYSNEKDYKKLFFINLMFYLSPLLFLALIGLIVILFMYGTVQVNARQKRVLKDVPYISSDKKSVMINNKKYELRGDKVFDGFKEIGQIKDDKFYKKQ